MRSSLAALVLGATLAGCTDAKAPEVILRPLEPRRAHAIIERAVAANGLSARAGRSLTLAGGHALKEDVELGDGPYGIAYVTAEQIKEAEGQLPARDPNSSALRLIRPAPDAIVLVLYEDAYRYDVGDENSATLVTAEQTCERDVTDFIVNVVRRK